MPRCSTFRTRNVRTSFEIIKKLFILACESEIATAHAAFKKSAAFPLKRYSGPPDLTRTLTIVTGLRLPDSNSSGDATTPIPNPSPIPSPHHLIRCVPHRTADPWLAWLHAALKNPEPCWRWEPPARPLSSSRADGHRFAFSAQARAASRFGIGTRRGERRVVVRPRQLPSLSSPPPLTLGRPRLRPAPLPAAAR